MREWNYPSRVASGGARQLNNVKGNDMKVHSKVHAEDRKRCVLIDYTNYRGERRVREIKPIELEFTATKWHPVTQYLLRAKDMEDGVVKHFALVDIHATMPVQR